MPRLVSSTDVLPFPTSITPMPTVAGSAPSRVTRLYVNDSPRGSVPTMAIAARWIPRWRWKQVFSTVCRGHSCAPRRTQTGEILRFGVPCCELVSGASDIPEGTQALPDSRSHDAGSDARLRPKPRLGTKSQRVSREVVAHFTNRTDVTSATASGLTLQLLPLHHLFQVFVTYTEVQA